MIFRDYARRCMGTKRGVEYFIIMQPDVQTTNWLEKFFILDS